jgi:hypothetical protein
MEWNGMEWNGNGMGMEWNEMGMEWEWNGMRWEWSLSLASRRAAAAVQWQQIRLLLGQNGESRPHY